MEFLLVNFSGVFFIVELFAGEAVFCFGFPHRKLWALRYFLCALACALVMYLIPADSLSSFGVLMLCFAFFGVSFLVIWFSFEASVWDYLLASVAGYAVQHLGYQVRRILWETGMDYLPLGETGQILYLLGTLILSDALVCILAYLFLARNWQRGGLNMRNNRLVILIGAGVLIVTLVISSFSSPVDSSLQTVIVDASYAILCSLFSLALLFSIMRQNSIREELNIVQSLQSLEKEQFERTRDNIDIINVKCHDLKYRIRNLQNGGNIDTEELKEVEEAVEIYDSGVETGNETLDILLTEKSLYCHRESITLSCIADGERLGFMHENDLYSLFGNAIDNAIRAVREFEDPADRLISLQVRGRGEMVSVNIENRYKGKVEMRDGLPVSTKKDARGYHGYGVRSMEMIAKKYGGTFSVRAEDGVFKVSILFHDINGMKAVA